MLPVVEGLIGRLPRSQALGRYRQVGGRAAAALDAGAAVVNDVSGLRLDPRMGEVVARAGAGLVLMHSRGDVSTMASDRSGHLRDGSGARYRRASSASRLNAREAPVSETPPWSSIPGSGSPRRRSRISCCWIAWASFARWACPLLVGPSRKRFLGLATARPLEDRDRATAVACVMAFERGARLFRVHDVATSARGAGPRGRRPRLLSPLPIPSSLLPLPLPSPLFPYHDRPQPAALSVRPPDDGHRAHGISRHPGADGHVLGRRRVHRRRRGAWESPIRRGRRCSCSSRMSGA